MKGFLSFCVVCCLSCVVGHAGVLDLDMAVERANAYLHDRPDSAVIYADKLLREEAGNLNPAQKSSLFIIKGNGKFNLGKTDDALDAMEQAVDIARLAGDSVMLAEALGNAGVVYRVSGSPDKALACYDEALGLVHRGAGDVDDEMALLTSVAALYANSGRLEEAVPYARRAVELSRDSEDLETVMYARSQAGVALFLAGEEEEGLDVERSIVSLAGQKASPRHALKAYTALVQMFNVTGRPDSVDFYMALGNEAVKLLPEGSMESLGFLEESAVLLASNGDYAQSQQYLRKIMNMKDAARFMPMNRLWMRMARNYHAMGQADSSAEAYEQSIMLADSLRQSEIDSQLSEFNVRYDTMEKELEIARLHEERNRSRMQAIIWFGAVIILIVAVAAWLALRRRRDAMMRIRENLKGIEQERARLARELHDGVCNDLYAITLMMGAEGCRKDTVVSELRRISSDVRDISHELMPPAFSNASLPELLADLAKRSGGFITFTCQGKPDTPLTTEESYQIYRIVQELVANVRKHSDASRIILSVASADGGAPTVTISYKGDSLPAPVAGKGIGLATIESRAELIGARIVSSFADGMISVVITK